MLVARSSARVRSGALLFASLVIGCRAAPAAHESAPRPEPAPSSALPPPSSAVIAPPRAVQAPELEFVEVMTGGAPLEAREPLVLAIHGLGDRPEGFVGLFEGFAAPARVIAPHSQTKYADGYSWFDFRRGDPDFSAPGIRIAAESLARFVRSVAARRPTAGKPIVVGFSQGGALSFALAALHGEGFAEAFPIGGWFPSALWPARKPDQAPPIVAFHGTADPLVPLARMRPGAARLAELGFSVDVREFDGIGHTISAAERRAIFDELAKACDRERRAP